MVIIKVKILSDPSGADMKALKGLILSYTHHELVLGFQDPISPEL